MANHTNENSEPAQLIQSGKYEGLPMCDASLEILLLTMQTTNCPDRHVIEAEIARRTSDNARMRRRARRRHLQGGSNG